MNDKDKEEFSKWWNPFIHSDTFTQTAKDAWKAACQYKSDEYSNIMQAMTQTSQNNFKLQAENKKLRQTLEFYADQANWVGYHRHVDTIRSCDCEPGKALEDGFDILLGGKKAREALKEVGEE
jgi:hypothetical protein